MNDNTPSVNAVLYREKSGKVKTKVLVVPETRTVYTKDDIENMNMFEGGM